MWNSGFTGKGVDVALVDSGVVPVHMVLAPNHPPVSDWQIRTVTRTCGP